MTRFFILFICLLQLSFVFSQQEEKEDKSELYYINNENRHWMLEIPLWVPGFRGQFTFGDVNMSSTEDSEKERERFSSQLGLEFYFVGRASYELDKWLFSIDAFSGRINSKIKFDRILNSNEADLLNITIQGTIPRFFAGYAVFDHEFESQGRFKAITYLGFRFVDLTMNSVVLDSIYSSSINPGYFEPILGLYISQSWHRFLFSLSGDYGVIDTKSSWMINSQIQFRFGKLVHMKFGWNHLALNHGKEYYGKDLDLKIVLTGPALGVGFRF